MPDESRVKPQPLQPQERAHLLLMLRTRPDRCDPYTCGKAADEIEALATIEEARSEQPVRLTDEQLKAGMQAAKEYGGDTTGWDREQCLRQQVQAILEAALAAAPKEGTDG